jgi:hypothetical protein
MDGHNTDALFVRGCTQDRNLGKPLGWRSKSTGKSKSPGKSLRKCWKCGKTEHVFLGDDLIERILGCGMVKLLLNNGRIRNLPRVLHIPKLAKSLIFVSKLGDVGVKTVF